MNTKLWMIIRDDSKKTYEVFGQTTNDNGFTNKTYAMQQAGMQVTCLTPPVTNKTSSKNLIKIIGYAYEEGLHERLLKEYLAIKMKDSFDEFG